MTRNSESKKKNAQTTEPRKTLYLVTGLAGSGKSSALRALDDIGYHCVDKLPIELIPSFLSYWESSEEEFAIQVSFESAEEKRELLKCFEGFCGKVTLIFLDCSDEVILRRYKETRRPHPLRKTYPDYDLADLVKAERELTQELRAKADHVIDTSKLSPHELRAEVQMLEGASEDLKITIESFGFKYGPGTDFDLILDVRFLPNPHFVSELKPHTGLEEEVKNYVFESGEAAELVEMYSRLLGFLIPKYKQEGKRYLKIGIGCTGGKHRSVAVTEALVQKLKTEFPGIAARHRDLPAS